MSLTGPPFNANVKEDNIIGRTTSVEDIINALAKRGCPDLTSSIDLAACKEHPYAFGGFCDVFQGALLDNTEVAIKRLRLYDGPEAERDSEKQKILKRAARELYHWSKLRHRNIIPLLGLAIFRGHMSMISQWMDNGNLSAFTRINPNADRNKLYMDVCEGLHYIHMSNMVHGDLKAANVMISLDGTAMIADFGNAQLKDLTLKFTHTKTGGVSIRWAAPELLLQDDCPQMSKEADVYAYGMTALEVLTGNVPYEGISDNRVMMSVAYEGKLPPRPETDISDELWRILNLCWAREPSERPDITEVKSLLQTLFPSPSPAPIPPQPPGPSFRIPLDILYYRNGGNVPKILSKCVEAIEKYGLDSVGIYKDTAERPESQAWQLKELLDRDLDAVNLDSDEWVADIYTVASVLKMWLRELPEPLMTWQYSKWFIECAKPVVARERGTLMHQWVNMLPDANYVTLKYLMGHLHRVLEREHVNQISRHRLGIEFGPTLLGAHARNPGSKIQDLEWTSKVVETILDKYVDIFVVEDEE